MSTGAGAQAGATPLFFHHVAKTGGTSFVRAMRVMVPPALQLSESGDLSAAFTQRLAAGGLSPGQFIYGHPGSGAALPLRGQACMAVMLREPREQAISNYLWLLRDRRLPDHAAAKALDFRSFLLERPYFAIFQTASLHVGMQQQPLGRTEDLIDRLPAILDYLAEFEIVGATERAALFHQRACAALKLVDPIDLPHHRRSRLPAAAREAMREQYEDLTADPRLGPLLLAERELYATARGLERSRRSAAGDRPTMAAVGSQLLAG